MVEPPQTAIWVFRIMVLELCLALCVIGAIFWALRPLQQHLPDEDEGLLDEELMTRYVAGDERAFNLLMSRYQGKVYGYIFRHFYDEDKATELFQDSFFKVIRAAHTYVPSRSFSTWLFTIVRNTIIDQFKKKKLKMWSLDAPLKPGEKKRSFGDLMTDHEAYEGEQESRRIQLARRLQEALGGLNPDQREVFQLRQFEGLPFAEIAVIMDCPVNTAKTRMRLPCSWAA